MKVMKKAQIWDAYYFDGTWEGGLEILKNFYYKYGKVVSFNGNDVFLELDNGRFVVEKNHWLVKEDEDNTLNFGITIFTDEEFSKTFHLLY